jgi:hypothetical protein
MRWFISGGTLLVIVFVIGLAVEQRFQQMYYVCNACCASYIIFGAGSISAYKLYKRGIRVRNPVYSGPDKFGYGSSK